MIRLNVVFVLILLSISGCASTGQQVKINEHQKKIQELEEALADERKMVKKVTEQLFTLRPPLTETALTIGEIIAVPEDYLNKEIVVKGVLISGTLNLNNPIAMFSLREEHSNYSVLCFFETDKLDPASRRLLVKNTGKTNWIRGKFVRASEGLMSQLGKKYGAKYELDVIRVELGPFENPQ